MKEQTVEKDRPYSEKGNKGFDHPWNPREEKIEKSYGMINERKLT